MTDKTMIEAVDEAIRLVNGHIRQPHEHFTPENRHYARYAEAQSGTVLSELAELLLTLPPQTRADALVLSRAVAGFAIFLHETEPGDEDVHAGRMQLLRRASERLMVFLHRDAGVKLDPAYGYFMGRDILDEANAD